MITSPAGSVEATVYKYPAIRPDTIAMPFGQGHTAFGRFAAKRGRQSAGPAGHAPERGRRSGVWKHEGAGGKTGRKRRAGAAGKRAGRVRL